MKNDVPSIKPSSKKPFFNIGQVLRLPSNYQQHLIKFQSLIALVILCVLIGLLSDKFFTVANGWNVMRQISVNICISVGMTLVVLTAGIDLSVGSILALCGAITAGLLKFGLEIPAAN
ncbi:MAG: hypothetical protein ACFCUU_17365, partial [Cyclobacteriaceae bacterium]